MNETASSTASERRQKSKRTLVSIEVGVRKHLARKERAKLRDISIHGFRAEVFGSVCPDETVWLSLPGLEGWQARVAWARGDEVGCEFVQPLHPAVVSTFLTRISR